MSERETAQWKLAALLKDRTRRAIRDRVRAGESAASVADDYGVPVQFVEVVASWQIFEDDAAALPPGDAPQTCPHCKLPAVMPEVCTPEINAVIEDSIEQDWALLNKGVEIGKALAAPVDAPQTCEWRGDVGNGYYNTGCEVATDYFEDAPTSTAIGWKFCPYCGKPLTLAQEEPIRPPVEGQTP